MAAHSNILAWRIPWTEEPGGLQSMGLQTVRHNWVTNASHFNMMNRLNNHLTFFLWFCIFPFALLSIGCILVFFINNIDNSEYYILANIFQWCLPFYFHLKHILISLYGYFKFLVSHFFWIFVMYCFPLLSTYIFFFFMEIVEI